MPPAGDAEHTAAISRADLFGDDQPARTGDVAAVPPAQGVAGHDRHADDTTGDG